jgi:hypothetical protein
MNNSRIILSKSKVYIINRELEMSRDLHISTGSRWAKRLSVSAVEGQEYKKVTKWENFCMENNTDIQPHKT